MFQRLRKTLSLLGAIFNGIGTRHLGLIAAGVAFYGLLAIFPAITSIVTLWGFFADPDLVEQELATYREVIPEAAFGIIDAQVSAIASGPKEVLGWASAVSIGAALWASRAGVAAMIGGLNAVYQTPPRGGLRSMAFALLLTVVLIAVALVAMATVVVTPVLLAFLPLGAFTGLVLEILRWLIGGGVVLLGIGLLYRLGPNRDGRRSDLLSPGSMLAVVLWALVSWGFSTYLENFNRYNEIYGSLGAVVAMLMWFYLSAFVVLLGGLTNAEMEARISDEAPEAAPGEPLEPAPQTAPLEIDEDRRTDSPPAEATS
ncbi:YihY/virulence factor BrkB family protein [Tropicimonas sediminicola]|uniref:Membrane protein n=1 Tax=Tropicimonas sediminicola TaxID=1031541 RepID=A0A239KIV3_9RHOB|nr:YihY/virulence factor BrkB family protein [Tropicimonas sediminicola]SNT17638.1 membrane protein [Tropicimonas sediminicola]